jgi:hypothetical protein
MLPSPNEAFTQMNQEDANKKKNKQERRQAGRQAEVFRLKLEWTYNNYS